MSSGTFRRRFKRRGSTPCPLPKIKNEMTTIKVGESYIHKLTGDKLKVIKIFDGVAKCETEQETVISERPYLATKTQICNLDNLK